VLLIPKTKMNDGHASVVQAGRYTGDNTSEAALGCTAKNAAGDANLQTFDPRTRMVVIEHLNKTTNPTRWEVVGGVGARRQCGTGGVRNADQSLCTCLQPCHGLHRHGCRDPDRLPRRCTEVQALQRASRFRLFALDLPHNPDRRLPHSLDLVVSGDLHAHGRRSGPGNRGG
jgi:hypothetical protein